MQSSDNKGPSKFKIDLDKLREQMFLIKSKLAVLEKAALYVADECRDDSGLDEHLYLCIKDVGDCYSQIIVDLQDALQQQLPEDLV